MTTVSRCDEHGRLVVMIRPAFTKQLDAEIRASIEFIAATRHDPRWADGAHWTPEMRRAGVMALHLDRPRPG